MASALFESIPDARLGADRLRARRYGVIETSGGQLQRIVLRPWPFLISLPEVWPVGPAWRPAGPSDTCRLYYNQPRGHANFLALKYVACTRGTSYATLRAALATLDLVAEIKRTDALLCDASNQRLSERFLRRMGWEPTPGAGGAATTSGDSTGITPRPTRASTRHRRSWPGLGGLLRSRALEAVRAVPSMSYRTTLLLIVLSITPLPGCGRVVFRPQQPQAVSLTPQQQQLYAQQQQELQRRADQLDTDNQELEALLAQSRQQVQLLTDQVVLTQDQLAATTERLQSSQQDNADLKTRTEALVASVRQPIGASIRPNSTLLQPFRLTGVPGIDIRQDGDVIRVSLSTDTLFYTGTSQLQPTGQRLIESVAGELVRNYPDHRIGVEGHTDGAPIRSSQHASSHHLSLSQATTAYDVLVRGGVPAEQLFVVGHGANHPLVSNATEAGRQKNRRVELVVYPETTRSR